MTTLPTDGGFAAVPTGPPVGDHLADDRTELMPVVTEWPPATDPAATTANRTAGNTPATAEHHPVLTSCPDCGASAMVELTRRDAQDFCPKCDFPLFWARTDTVIGTPFDSSGDASRRLPGTVGRSTVASVPCPHCGELNVVTATVCVRCNQSMRLLPTPPPPPAPPRPPLPEPALEPLEDADSRWWLWLLVLLTLLMVAGIVLLAVRPWQ